MSAKKRKQTKSTTDKAGDKVKNALRDQDLEQVSGGAFGAVTKQASAQAASPDAASGWKSSMPYPSIDTSSDDSDSSSDSSDDSSSSGSSSSSAKST